MFFGFLIYCLEQDRQAELYYSKFPPIQKEFYLEHPEISSLEDEDVQKIRDENNKIAVYRLPPEKPKLTGSEDEQALQMAKIAFNAAKPIQKPILEFYQAFHNIPDILEVIEQAGFTKPSPIQMQAWPVLLSGEDMIGIAQTGTGKRLWVFLKYMLNYIFILKGKP